MDPVGTSIAEGPATVVPQDKEHGHVVDYDHPQSSTAEDEAKKPAAPSDRQVQPFELEEARETPIDHEDNFPEGGLQAWLVLFAAFITLFTSFGFMVSIGTMQDYWMQHQLRGMSSRDIGWIPSVFVYLALALGIGAGPLFDMYGPRWMMAIGSVAYIAMLFLLAECTTFWQIILCLGFLGGVSAAALTTTSLACVAHWFKRRRGLAQGIAMAGSSFGGLTIPLILRTTFETYGYKWSIRILAFAFTGCLIIGNILLRARIPPNPAAKKKAIIDLSMFLDLRFSLFTISVFGLELVIFSALGILPTYATLATDFDKDTGFYLISILNGVSCLGRLIPGYIADRIGRFNTMAISIVLTLVLMLAIWLPLGTSSLGALYTFVALFGFCTGCWMALIPSCLGQLCRAEEFGRYYGTCYFIGSLSALVCIPISGELLQTVGAQALIAFFCAITGITIGTFCLSRWACLGWKWSWKAKL